MQSFLKGDFKDPSHGIVAVKMGYLKLEVRAMVVVGQWGRRWCMVWQKLERPEML